MSKRFTPPTAEELAERGLNPDGTPMEKSKPAPKATAKAKAPATSTED